MDSLGAIDPGPFLESAAMDKNRRILKNGNPEAKRMVFLEELLRNIFLKPFLTQPSAIFSDEEDEEENDIISKENSANGGEIYNSLIRDLLAKELAQNKSFGFNKAITKRIENGGAREEIRSDDKR